MFGDVPQSLTVGAGVFTRNETEITPDLLAAGEAIGRPDDQQWLKQAVLKTNSLLPLLNGFNELVRNASMKFGELVQFGNNCATNCATNRATGAVCRID